MPARLPDDSRSDADLVTAANAGEAAAFEALYRRYRQWVVKVWARQYIAQLVDRTTYDRDLDLPQQIESIALQYGLMSAYTSFVAVDSKTRTQGAHGTTVHVAVPVPEGVRYETTVQESVPR